MLDCASPELKADRDIVSAALHQEGFALEHASPELKADCDFILEAVCQDGLVVECASPELKADCNVVLVAVQQNGLVLECARFDDRQNDVAIGLQFRRCMLKKFTIVLNCC